MMTARELTRWHEMKATSTEPSTGGVAWTRPWPPSPQTRDVSPGRLPLSCLGSPSHRSAQLPPLSSWPTHVDGAHVSNSSDHVSICLRGPLNTIFNTKPNAQLGKRVYLRRVAPRQMRATLTAWSIQTRSAPASRQMIVG
jgi:hypothetical protein